MSSGTDSNEDESLKQLMMKKKETVILMSLKRKAELEAKKALREAETARKREEEANKKALIEHKKLEHKQRREAILEHYRQKKKAAETVDRDSAPTHSVTNSHSYPHHPPQSQATIAPTAPSSTTNYEAQVTTLSSQYRNSQLSQQNAHHNNNTHLHHNSHQPQHQNSHNQQQHHTSAWTLYTGPKLFAKPTTKTNLVTIQNAILKALEGAANAKTLKKMQDTISNHSKSCSHFLILFRNRHQFRGLYEYDEKQGSISKLDGIGPKSINNEDIIKYYKFDSPKRQFTEVQTRHISLTIIAFTIHDHLWSKPTLSSRMLSSHDLVHHRNGH